MLLVELVVVVCYVDAGVIKYTEDFQSEIHYEGEKVL